MNQLVGLANYKGRIKRGVDEGMYARKTRKRRLTRVNELTSPGWNRRPQSTCHFSSSGGTSLHIYTLFASHVHTHTHTYLLRETKPTRARCEGSELFHPRRDSPFRGCAGHSCLSGTFKMTMIRDTSWAASASSSASSVPPYLDLFLHLLIQRHPTPADF